MTVKLSISLTDQQAAYAKKLVNEGRFSSTSAVIQQAVEEKRREEEEYQAWKRDFVAMMRRRMEGPFVPMDEFRQNVEDMLERKRIERGLAD